MCPSFTHPWLLPTTYWCSHAGPASTGGRAAAAHPPSWPIPTLPRVWIDFELHLNCGLYLRMYFPPSDLMSKEKRSSQMLHKCHFLRQVLSRTYWDEWALIWVFFSSLGKGKNCFKVWSWLVWGLLWVFLLAILVLVSLSLQPVSTL